MDGLAWHSVPRWPWVRRPPAFHRQDAPGGSGRGLFCLSLLGQPPARRVHQRLPARVYPEGLIHPWRPLIGFVALKLGLPTCGFALFGRRRLNSPNCLVLGMGVWCRGLGAVFGSVAELATLAELVVIALRVERFDGLVLSLFVISCPTEQPLKNLG